MPSDLPIIFIDQMPAEKYPEQVLAESMPRAIIGSPMSVAIMSHFSFFAWFEEQTINTTTTLINGWRLVWGKSSTSDYLNLDPSQNYTRTSLSDIDERVGYDYRIADLIIIAEGIPQDDFGTMGREKFLSGEIDRFFSDFDRAFQLESLPNGDDGEKGSYTNKQGGKRGDAARILREFLGIEGQLFRIFRQLPIYLNLFISMSIAGIACFLAYFGFVFFNQRRWILGSSCVLF